MSKAIGKVLRGVLGLSGMLIYHMGLADAIIRRSPDRVRTLLYHAIENQPNPHIDGLNVSITTRELTVHLDYVKRHYSVVSEDDITRGTHDECPLTITFDDGYKSVEEHAVPLLQEYELPATIYLIGSAVMGNHVWVNQLNHAVNTQADALRKILQDYPELKKLRLDQVVHHVQSYFSPSAIELLMFRLEQDLPVRYCSAGLFSNDSSIQQMKTKGISFGFHTRDHYNLQNCSASITKRQLDPRFISYLLNSNTFAYPFGLYSNETMRQLSTYGLDRLMTVNDSSKEAAWRHQSRSEIMASTAAGMFAQLEVVEPLMAKLHQLVKVLRKTLTLSNVRGLPSAG